MQVQVNWARERAESVLVKAGLNDDQAALVSDALIEADLRGRATHGLIRLNSIVGRMKRMARRPVRIETNRGAAVLVDGGNELGYLVSDFCGRVAIERCREHGIALVAAHDSSHAGMLGYFAERIARADLMGLCFTNCLPKTAPAGATQAVFGTNPLAIAIPTSASGSGPASDPILLDFATSAATIGDMLLAARDRRLLPEGVAVDADGTPTTDPTLAQKGALLAFGGHKGSGLAFAIQLMCTAFTGATVFPGLGKDYGYIVMACDPFLFVSRTQFFEGVRELIWGLKSARPGQGVAEVRYPGERAFRARRRALAEGIVLDEPTARLLASAAASDR